MYTTSITNIIAPRVIELTYTAWDLKPFAEDVLAEIGSEQWNSWFPDNPISSDGVPQPFVWDEERRFSLRCDLDALYFHLYDISRENVDYIMETFPIVKRKDIAAYGTYRTKDVILERFDALEKEMVRYYDEEEGRFVVRMKADLNTAGGDSEEPEWKVLIAGGETDRVEFKSSISWDVREKRKNKDLEHTIAKTLASFMNTAGGMLFIGVTDDGEIVGLDPDIKISKGKDEDGLKLRFDDLVKHHLGNRFLPLISIQSHGEDGKTFWALEIQPADEPVYVSRNSDEEFWIRGSASSRRLSMKEAIEYIRQKWSA